jgi:hypothetical protein
VNEVGYTPYEFFLRFTAAEREAIRSASLSDATTADILQSLNLADMVVNTDPRVTSGMSYLVSTNLLTQARAEEILGNV